MALILTSLENALQSLQKVIETLGNETPQSAPFRLELRDSAIQRFEYCYELSVRFLKRQMEELSPNPQEIDQVSFHDLLRRAAEAGLLSDVEAFMDYRLARNLTSHAYDERKAEKVHALLPQFLHDAQNLLTELKKRNAR